MTECPPYWAPSIPRVSPAWLRFLARETSGEKVNLLRNRPKSANVTMERYTTEPLFEDRARGGVDLA